ncbi:hypothetical protein DTO217A2_7014 [Paecilomyces variotii]|nr:hypothetical protein DTO217A2_7014 [Paecilomyces variotii]
MSAGLPYLKSLRKGDLLNLADVSDLKREAGILKAELETALDEHLSSNKDIFSGDKRFADYYRRLSQPSRLSSPVKKEAKTDAIASGDDIKKSARRRTTKAKEESDVTDESDSGSVIKSPVPVTTRTPARSPLSFTASLPPSPAVVTEAIDRQTALARKKVSDAWAASRLTEHSDSLRSALSSVKSIEAIIIALEGFSLVKELVPLKFLTTVAAVDAIHTPEFAVKVPDLFVLLTGSFWAPFSLWLTTSLFLPLTFAYFFNLSLKAGQPAASHSYGTRRTASSSQDKASFDPLVYNIAKALISYLVYANHFTFWDIYSNFSIEKVNVSIPGQWAGVLTGTAIGGIGSLYEAVLKK